MTDKNDGASSAPRRHWLARTLLRFGVDARREPGRKFSVQFQIRFYYALGTALFVLFASFLGAAKYSESARFCNSCHIMEPYYNAWKTSKHNDIACVECHYPPGKPQTILWKKFQALSQVVKYVTRTYSSKPFAEVEDSACLKCHSTRLLEGKLVTSRGIRFDHWLHLTTPRRGRRLACTSCHGQMVVGNHMEVSWDTCYLCHFKGMGTGKDLEPLGGCLGCHELPARSFQIGAMRYNHKDFVVKRGVSCRNCHADIVQGGGEATQDRCFTCHNQPEKLAKINDIPFLHENHVTKHNVACFHCHKEIRHSLREGKGSQLADLGAVGAPAPKDAVHKPALAIDCNYCHENKHQGQREMYSGEVAFLGLPEIPSPMHSAQVDCVGCHYQEEPDRDKEFRGKTFKASEEACVKCHGERFRGVLEETRSDLKATLEQLGAKLEKAGDALAKAGSPEGTKGLRERLAEAERWHHFVRASRGEHNIYLASLVLRREDKALTEIGEELKAGFPDLSALPLLSGAFCATMCHQKVGVEVPPETVRFKGKSMPHKQHAEMFGCVQCHEIGAHKKTPLRKGVDTFCATCHPQ